MFSLPMMSRWTFQASFKSIPFFLSECLFQLSCSGSYQPESWRGSFSGWDGAKASPVVEWGCWPRAEMEKSNFCWEEHCAGISKKMGVKLKLGKTSIIVNHYHHHHLFLYLSHALNALNFILLVLLFCLLGFKQY